MYSCEPNRIAIATIYREISGLEYIYPNFASWFWQKVAPGVNDGSRSIFLHSRGNNLTGVIIAKRSQTERKLCTVWVKQPYRGQKIAPKLIGAALHWLECTHPLITIPEERLASFAPIISHLGFMRTQILRDYYRPGHREFVFNGQFNITDQSFGQYNSSRNSESLLERSIPL